MTMPKGPNMSKRSCLILVAALTASPAAAHITLETKQATVGSYYKAVFAVPHGCKGSPTVKIRVQIPEGVIGVKPMPKAGWTVGGGLEAALSGPWTAKVEYLYADLGRGTSVLGADTKFNASIVRAGLNYRF